MADEIDDDDDDVVPDKCVSIRAPDGRDRKLPPDRPINRLGATTATHGTFPSPRPVREREREREKKKKSPTEKVVLTLFSVLCCFCWLQTRLRKPLLGR